MQTLKVNTTKNYSMFKSIDGNRTKNALHIRRLKKSMEENFLLNIIIVNEKYEIIDGQHSFDCIRNLGYPVNYIIMKGYGLKEVHILNATSKTWNADDFMAGYVDLGYKDYIEYKMFKEKYGLDHYTCQRILTNEGIGSVRKSKSFNKGEFKVKNIEQAQKTIEKIYQIGTYYKGYKRRSFIHAMLALFKNPEFKFNEFILKLKQQGGAMYDCATTSQYIVLIEEIYNYRRHDKVNLRYFDYNKAA